MKDGMEYRPDDVIHKLRDCLPEDMEHNQDHSGRLREIISLAAQKRAEGQKR